MLFWFIYFSFILFYYLYFDVYCFIRRERERKAMVFKERGRDEDLRAVQCESINRINFMDENIFFQ